MEICLAERKQQERPGRRNQYGSVEGICCGEVRFERPRYYACYSSAQFISALRLPSYIYADTRAVSSPFYPTFPPLRSADDDLLLDEQEECRFDRGNVVLFFAALWYFVRLSYEEV